MKYVALDIGNVLVHADFTFFVEELSKHFNISLEEAMYFMNRSQKMHDLGLTSMKDELRHYFNVKSPVLMDELLAMWNDCIHPETLMLDKLLHLMKDYDLQVALLSNVGPEHAKRMAQILGHKGFFDKCIKYFSCDVGARKPTSVYYQTFLQRNINFQGCAYLDDLQENLDASKQFEFRTFRFSLQEDLPKGPDYKKNFDKKWKEIEKFILADC